MNMKNRTIRKRPLSYERKKSMVGYLFIGLWLIGFLQFFIRPFIMVVRFSLSDISFKSNGYSIAFKGLDYYKQALFEDPDFLTQVVNSFRTMLINVPLIVLISLLIAALLNDKFRGRLFFRAVFFTPVIVATGLVISILKGDQLAQMALEGSKNVTTLQAVDLKAILLQMKLPAEITTIVFNAVNSMFDLLWKSGIQILLFLSAMQNIPGSVYEASSIEGATRWDIFWKIEIPMVSPMILLSVIYSIIDNFIDSNNVLMNRITQLVKSVNFSFSSAMAILYFIVAMIFIGIVYKVVNRFIVNVGD